MTRLGGRVVGIDATANSIKVASEHRLRDPKLADNSNLTYIHTSVEELLARRGSLEPKQFDVITCMEVIEHLHNKSEFLGMATKLLKKDGYLILSTINDTVASYFKLIFAAEYILNVVERGTHNWSKFISPTAITNLAREVGLVEIHTQGYEYDIIRGIFQESESRDGNYIIGFQKSLNN